MIEGRRKSTQIMYTALKKLLCDGRETKKSINGLSSKSFRKNKSETNLRDWRKNSIVTLRDTLYSKIKRLKGLLLLFNGIPIVGKIFRNVDQGGYRGLLTRQGNSSRPLFLL